MAGLALSTACAGCPPSTPTGVAIERLSVAQESLAAAPELGIGATAFELQVEQAMAKQGAPVGKGQAAKRTFRLRAEVEFARTGRVEWPDAGQSEAQTVGVLLELNPTGAEHGARIAAPSSATETTKLHPEPDVRGASFQRALAQAIATSAATLVRTAWAQELDSAALRAQLTSPDAGVREAAADVLVDRKDAAAIPVLIGELGSEDDDLQLKAIGELVELKATEAVPKLIDLTQAHNASQPSDPHLQIQVVYALGSIGGDEAEAFLYTMGSGHPDAAIRRAASEASSELRASRAKRTATASTGGPPPSSPNHPP